MHWLTQLAIYGRVILVADMRNARPAFTNPSDLQEDADA